MAACPTYGDGTIVAIGDRVLIEHGRTKGVVEILVFSDEDLALYKAHNEKAEMIAFGRVLDVGVQGPFAILLSSPFGRVSWNFDNDNDPLRFVRRGTLNGSPEAAGQDVDEWW
jgi:hypothetical protein